MTVNELLRFVENEKLGNHFYYNDYGTYPYDVMLYDEGNGKFSVYVNGYERGYADQKRNVDENTAVAFCYKWLKYLKDNLDYVNGMRR